jgi:hypothetical protein
MSVRVARAVVVFQVAPAGHHGKGACQLHYSYAYTAYLAEDLLQAVSLRVYGVREGSREYKGR